MTLRRRVATLARSRPYGHVLRMVSDRLKQQIERLSDEIGTAVAGRDWELVHQLADDILILLDEEVDGIREQYYDASRRRW